MKQKYNNLSKLDFSISVGITIGLIIFLTTMISLVTGSNSIKFIAIMILGVYGSFGYSISPFGAIIGGIYAFIDSFILAYFFAFLYNRLLKFRNSSKKN